MLYLYYNNIGEVMKSQELKDIIIMGYATIVFVALYITPDLVFNQRSWIQVLTN